ncbi:MAG: hypothetical protein BAA01_16725 [Bacillus thermozeamaize]|uniref:Uncharacterized protein n=1 Tax=Bacillus thermozeamaize TaxID=230954 RepID=A0A1Y3PI71_9BACI|nr:MAG: hypothetical protein BAA01_16725 [Bacillus thermozeamaize]
MKRCWNIRIPVSREWRECFWNVLCPALFPFQFSLKAHELEETTLQLVRQGGNMTMVGVKQKRGAIVQE